MKRSRPLIARAEQPDGFRPYSVRMRERPTRALSFVVLEAPATLGRLQRTLRATQPQPQPFNAQRILAGVAVLLRSRSGRRLVSAPGGSAPPPTGENPARETGITAWLRDGSVALTRSRAVWTRQSIEGGRDLVQPARFLDPGHVIEVVCAHPLPVMAGIHQKRQVSGA